MRPIVTTLMSANGRRAIYTVAAGAIALLVVLNVIGEEDAPEWLTILALLLGLGAPATALSHITPDPVMEKIAEVVEAVADAVESRTGPDSVELTVEKSSPEAPEAPETPEAPATPATEETITVTGTKETTTASTPEPEVRKNL